MTLGYTGPKSGMTQRQAATVKYLFHELQLRLLHHGDCIGGDEQADRLAKAMQAQVIVHPPDDERFRAHCKGVEIKKPKPYLERDTDIAIDGVNGLVAALESRTELFQGSGTWATVRRARKAGRRIWKVWQDGTFEVEEPTVLTAQKASKIR